MSSLSQRLHLGVQQKQILTPGLVQMVTVLQLNRLELKDMITQEIAENPVLEESADGIEELTAEEVQSILEREWTAEPSDQNLLDTLNGPAAAESDGAGEFSEVRETTAVVDYDGNPPTVQEIAAPASPSEAEATEPKTEKDPFDEIDFGTFFDEYLD